MRGRRLFRPPPSSVILGACHAYLSNIVGAWLCQRQAAFDSEANVTLVQSRADLPDIAGRLANDAPTPDDFSILDLISSDDDAADLAKQRTERLGNVVVVIMAVCLIFPLAICFALAIRAVS